jgi:hypothetical protein
MGGGFDQVQAVGCLAAMGLTSGAMRWSRSLIFLLSAFCSSWNFSSSARSSSQRSNASWQSFAIWSAALAASRTNRGRHFQRKQARRVPREYGGEKVVTTEYEFHRLADLFPLMKEASAEFKAFANDIKERGQQEPATLLDGKILEGRNRYRACQKLGIELKVKQFDGDDPLAFVISANLHRRHLTESQRGMVAAKIANLKPGANQTAEGSNWSRRPAAQRRPGNR